MFVCASESESDREEWAPMAMLKKEEEIFFVGQTTTPSCTKPENTRKRMSLECADSKKRGGESIKRLSLSLPLLLSHVSLVVQLVSAQQASFFSSWQPKVGASVSRQS